MEHFMGERRKVVRQKSFLQGRVIFNNGRTSLDCLVREITPLGARIIFSDVVSIPDTVDLHLPQKNRTAHARVVWRHSDEIGLAFSESGRARSLPAAGDNIVERMEQLEAELISLTRFVKQLASKIDNKPEAA
jgi:hypothetical protein